MVPKLKIEWTKEESKEFDWNSKGLYTITRVINVDKYHQIQACRTSKYAWDILEVMYMGTASTVNRLD